MIHRQRWRAAVLVGLAALTLTACGHGSSTSSATPSPTPAQSKPHPRETPSAPPPLVTGADLHAKPVAIPLRFRIPKIGVDIPMWAVGLTPKNAMDAPEGPADDPVWNTGFWYRGGVEPGQPGVSTIAAHLDDSLGRPAAFWNLRKLSPGDTAEVLDQRTNTVIRFAVTEEHVYSLAEASTVDVLSRLFGPDAVYARPPKPAPDGISRLTLVTCTGVFTHGEYDHRYLVFLERADGPGSPSQPALPTPLPAAAGTPAASPTDLPH